MIRSTHLAFIIATFFIFISAGIADATILATSNSSVVYDDITNKYWISDLTLLSSYSYAEQQSTIDGWNSNGIYSSANWSNFHIASYEEVIALGQNYEHTFGLYEHLFTQNYDLIGGYSGRTSFYQPNSIGSHRYIYFSWWSNENWLYINDIMDIGDLASAPYIGAWVVADPVPEPASILLLSCGAMCFLIPRIKSRMYVKN